MGNKEIFASRLREARMQTGKTQKEFADMVESTAATISAYENATKNPSLEIVMNIARKCNISIDWLCGLSEEKGLIPKIETYKDIAIKVLELLSVNMFPFSFELKIYKEEDTDYEFALPGETVYHSEWALALPNEDKFLSFISTYNELNKLYINGQIKQNVIDTWLNGALEELKALPIVIPPEEFDDDILNTPIDE